LYAAASAKAAINLPVRTRNPCDEHRRNRKVHRFLATRRSPASLRLPSIVLLAFVRITARAGVLRHQLLKKLVREVGARSRWK
jgi:hypothetical protein